MQRLYHSPLRFVSQAALRLLQSSLIIFAVLEICISTNQPTIGKHGWPLLLAELGWPSPVCHCPAWLQRWQFAIAGFYGSKMLRNLQLIFHILRKECQDDAVLSLTPPLIFCRIRAHKCEEKPPWQQSRHCASLPPTPVLVELSLVWFFFSQMWPPTLCAQVPSKPAFKCHLLSSDT